MPTIDQVRTLIAKNRIDDAIIALKEIAPEQFRDEVLNLERQFNGLQSDSRKGILSHSEETLGRNKIASAILSLAREIANESDKREIVKPSPEIIIEPTPPIAKEVKKILFICSSPDGQNPLDFGREFKNIENARQLADGRNDYAVPNIKTGVEADNLPHILTKYQPDILHFSLHSSKSEGLYFENETGQAEPITAEDFKDIIATYISDPDGKGIIDTIVLSCCNSKLYGKQIEEYANHVIVTKDLFPDKAAVVYTKDFYKMLFNNKDIAYAHRVAKTAIKRKKYSMDGYNFPIHEIPELIKNNSK